MDIEDRCEAEVRELHTFFERWFRGEADEAELARVGDALAEDFELVSPRGLTDDRESILAALRGARGSRDGSFAIGIEAFAVRATDGASCLVTYEEHQPGTVRRSSAWFRESERGPRGVEWIHLHETWIKPPGR